MENSSPAHLSQLLDLHKVLEVEHGDGDRGNFLFGWQCANPFAAELLRLTADKAATLNRTEYSYMDEDEKLAENVLQLHQKIDGFRPQAVFCGAGATPILFASAAYVKSQGFNEVYYISPLYFSLQFAFRLLDIRARVISARHAFEENFSINLPNKKSVLFLTDPIWYSGLPVPPHVIEEIARWQDHTNSIVFVDGSFQYMRWHTDAPEPTAHLNPDNTFRLVSPTKSLAVHGYRFAYMFLPQARRADFSHTYTNICASSTADSIAFGYEAVRAMGERTLTRKLISLAQERHEQLRVAGTIQSALDPSCGYFVFEKLNKALPEGYVRMGGEFFDQPRFPEFVRLNLLSPSYHLIQ